MSLPISRCDEHPRTHRTKRIEQLPPQNAGGKMVEQGTVNNYQFISADGGWKVSLAKGFIALSTTRYTRWEEFAKRLDVVLAAFIKIYQPAYFTRVGLRYMNAVNKAALGLAAACRTARQRHRLGGLYASDDPVHVGGHGRHAGRGSILAVRSGADGRQMRLRRAV